VYVAGDDSNTYMKYSPLLGSRNYSGVKKYVTGGEKYLIPFKPGMADVRLALIRVNQDGTSGASVCDLTAGYGKYRIDVFYDSSKGNGWELIRSFTMDWSDSDYRMHYGNGSNADVQVNIFNTNTFRVTFNGAGDPLGDTINLSYFNNELQIWNQIHDTNFSPSYIKNPNKNNFRTTDTLNNLFLNSWPILGTDYSDPTSPGIHTTPGLS
ncbi:MAG: hypothetical protein JNJ56_06860, partial [Ignavibacteria bacterium]|nr:hypothetical protein [Ignavibacteria bacterium]